MSLHDMTYEFEGLLGTCSIEFEFYPEDGRAFATKVCQEHRDEKGKLTLYALTPFQLGQVNEYLQDEMVFHAREELMERRAA
jgi:hypothetical protein